MGFIERATPTCGSILFHGMRLTFISQQESLCEAEVCEIYILMINFFSSLGILPGFKYEL